MGHRKHTSAALTAALVTALAVPGLGHAQQPSYGQPRTTPPAPTTPAPTTPAPPSQKSAPPGRTPMPTPPPAAGTPMPAPGPMGTAPMTNAPAIDPAAIAHLNRMAAYLQTLIAFQVKADLSREEVLQDGEKVTFSAEADMVVQRPTRLRMTVNSERQQRLFLFDGQTFTLLAPKMGYYAQETGPKTIKDLVDVLEDKFELEMPLVDFFRWNEPDAVLGDLTGAKDMGQATIEGVTCEHYLLRQNGMDWQIWIQNGDFPLPRKVVLTTTDEEARPQYTAVYTWNLAPSFNASTFEFVAPEGSKKIEFGEVPTTLQRRER